MDGNMSNGTFTLFSSADYFPHLFFFPKPFLILMTHLLKCNTPLSREEQRQGELLRGAL